MDLPQQYQGQSVCEPPPKPGVARLQALLQKTYGTHYIYTSRACASDPSSEHTEGRALDWMVSMRSPSQRVKAQAFLSWLLARGADGTPAAMARRMGIMYIGWNNQIWRSYKGPSWGELKGCFSKTSTSYDTYCHRDHIHFSLTWDGAAGQSSYWDGTAQVDQACPSNYRSGSVVPIPSKVRRVNLPRPRVVLDTRARIGTGGMRCRIQEERWSGDRQLINANLRGAPGWIPGKATRVFVRLSTMAANANAKIFAWPSGTNRGNVEAFTAQMNRPKSIIRPLRVGTNGHISIATNTGDTYVRLEVLAYQIPG